MLKYQNKENHPYLANRRTNHSGNKKKDGRKILNPLIDNQINMKIMQRLKSNKSQKSIDSRVNKLKQIYVPNVKDRSRSRKKQDIGKISNLDTSIYDEISPFSYDSSIIQNHLSCSYSNSLRQQLKKQKKNLNKNQFDRVCEVMQKGQIRSQKIQKKINHLECISDKINDLIECLKQQKITQKYQTQLESQTDIKSAKREISNTKQFEANLQFKQRKSLPIQRNILNHNNYKDYDYWSKNKYNKPKYNSVPKNMDIQTNQPLRNSIILSKYKYKPHSSIYSIQDNLSKITNNYETTPSHNKKLAKRLLKQIKCDMLLMDSIVRLCKANKGNLDESLVYIIKKIKVYLPCLQRQYIMSIVRNSVQEKDPLYTDRIAYQQQNEQLLIDELIKVFVEAELYWKQKIYRKFSKNKLNLCILDRSDKNWLSKQDLIQFIYAHTINNQLKNRSIYIVWKRIIYEQSQIQQNNRLQKNNILQCFCQISSAIK